MIGLACGLVLFMVLVASVAAFVANPWRAVNLVETLGFRASALIALTVGPIEAALAVLLLLAPAYGGAAVAAYLGGVSLVMAVARLSGVVIDDCSCFKGKHPVDRTYFVRNSILIAGALVTFILGPKGSPLYGGVAGIGAYALVAVVGIRRYMSRVSGVDASVDHGVQL